MAGQDQAAGELLDEIKNAYSDFDVGEIFGTKVIVPITQTLRLLIAQAGAMQARGTGFHGKFIPVQNRSAQGYKPDCKRLAAIPFKRCIDRVLRSTSR